MPIVDRLEYPKKYKMSSAILLLAVLLAVGALLYQKYSNKARAKQITIHSIGFDEYDKNYIRVGYEIENMGKKDQEVALLIRVYDREGGEIASIFFKTNIKAHTREFQSKVIDELNRPLKEGEKPYRATIELRQREFMHY